MKSLKRIVAGLLVLLLGVALLGAAGAIIWFACAYPQIAVWPFGVGVLLLLISIAHEIGGDFV